MAGLSSVCSIPRSLGAVDIKQMNYVVGVYRVYLLGGGGGGGGYDSFYGWYGGAGGNGFSTSVAAVFLAPPISVTNGKGGLSSGGYGSDNGEDGGASQLLSRRRNPLISGVGAGGSSAGSSKHSSVQQSRTAVGKETARFTYLISYLNQQPPYDNIYTGRGGSSTSAGTPGGLVKAYRIG